MFTFKVLILAAIALDNLEADLLLGTSWEYSGSTAVYDCRERVYVSVFDSCHYGHYNSDCSLRTSVEIESYGLRSTPIETIHVKNCEDVDFNLKRLRSTVEEVYFTNVSSLRFTGCDPTISIPEYQLKKLEIKNVNCFETSYRMDCHWNVGVDNLTLSNIKSIRSRISGKNVNITRSRFLTHSTDIKAENLVFDENYVFILRAFGFRVTGNVTVRNNTFTRIDENAFAGLKSKESDNRSWIFKDNVIKFLKRGAFKNRSFASTEFGGNRIGCTCQNSHWFVSLLKSSKSEAENSFSSALLASDNTCIYTECTVKHVAGVFASKGCSQTQSCIDLIYVPKFVYEDSDEGEEEAEDEKTKEGLSDEELLEEVDKFFTSLQETIRNVSKEHWKDISWQGANISSEVKNVLSSLNDLKSLVSENCQGQVSDAKFQFQEASEKEINKLCNITFAALQREEPLAHVTVIPNYLAVIFLLVLIAGCGFFVWRRLISGRSIKLRPREQSESTMNLTLE